MFPEFNLINAGFVRKWLDQQGVAVDSFQSVETTQQETPVLTLAEAAKETGLTRSAIFKAIKNGKLSASKDEQGRFRIDPSELFRVYKPVNKDKSTSEQQETTKEAEETNELRARLDMMGQLLRQVEGERDDLRRRLDEEAAERRKLTALLTHQQQQPPAETPRPGFWRRLFGSR